MILFDTSTAPARRPSTARTQTGRRASAHYRITDLGRAVLSGKAAA